MTPYEPMSSDVAGGEPPCDAEFRGLSPEDLLRELCAHQEKLRARNRELLDAQMLLERSLAEYTDLYDFAPIGLVTLDPQGLVSRLNFAAAELLGVDQWRVVGLAFHAFVRGPEQPAWLEHLRRCRDGQPQVVTELTLVGQGGREFAAELISRPAIGDDGRRFFRTVLIDLTERKRAEARMADLNRELEQRTREAEQRAALLGALTAKLNEAEQAERRRLARNLHDHLQQELVAAKFRVAVGQAKVAGGEVAAALREIEAALDRCLSATREITSDLVPPPLGQGAGLIAALRWLADRMHDRHGLTVTVVGDPDAEPRRDVVRTLLFEAARELLFNVVKHAGTREARVELSRRAPDRIRLTVSDEGHGFDVATLISRADDATGLGLFGLRERVENLGGTVDVLSGPSCGTDVTILIRDIADPDFDRRTDRVPR